MSTQTLPSTLFDYPVSDRDMSHPSNWRVNKRRYFDLIALRYSDRLSEVPYTDAMENWDVMQKYRTNLLCWLQRFHVDRELRVGSKCHNPKATLTGMLWLASKSEDMAWLLSFEAKYQAHFLRRGLLDYCGLLLDSMKLSASEIEA